MWGWLFTLIPLMKRAFRHFVGNCGNIGRVYGFFKFLLHREAKCFSPRYEVTFNLTAVLKFYEFEISFNNPAHFSPTSIVNSFFFIIST